MSLKIDPEDIITLDDGFKYYWPSDWHKGAFSSHNLREIADFLDEVNEPWQKKIDEYFVNRVDTH
jgi:hypothetical protein